MNEDRCPRGSSGLWWVSLKGHWSESRLGWCWLWAAVQKTGSRSLETVNTTAESLYCTFTLFGITLQQRLNLVAESGHSSAFPSYFSSLSAPFCLSKGWLLCFQVAMRLEKQKTKTKNQPGFLCHSSHKLG